MSPTFMRFSVLALVAIACVLLLSGTTVTSVAARSSSVRAARGDRHLFSPHQRVELEHQLGDGTRVEGGSKNCVACALIVSLVEQFAWDHNLSLTTAANQWCTDATSELPGLAGICELLVGPIIAKLQTDFANAVTPHVSCSTTLNMCDAPYSQCTLFSTWPPAPHSADAPRVGVHEAMNKKERHAFYAETAAKLLNVHTLTDRLIEAKLTQLLKAGVTLPKEAEKFIGSSHKLPVPSPDWDQDRYGASFSYRGIQFHGKDCNDFNSSIYPGRNAFQGDYDASEDTNCNGIWGVNQASGMTWEEQLCEGTPSRGILAIGDSATAHFSLPPTYMTPSGFNMSTYAHLIQEFTSEADWPQCSWSTAWSDNSQCPYSTLNVSSVYQKMTERNRCMHRDYVNAGVNGASVDSMIPDGIVTPENYTGLMSAYPKRYGTDGPSTVFFSLVGNDICGVESDGYTPVDVFAAKALEEFRYLDTILAAGSHVVIMGLVDGRVLFDTLHNLTHPIGTTYAEFYDYLNCLNTSPCWGWMNTNQTVRDASTARAFEFNAAYQTIIAEESFKNFDLHYIFPDFAKLISEWVAMGHVAKDLIEPVDGFHPSQTGNMLLADVMWNFLEANVPEAMGTLNPNNDIIIQQFADQGGYQ